MFEPFARADQRRGAGSNCGRLLLGQRKSVEQMAARLGIDGNRQALTHFITSSTTSLSHLDPRGPGPSMGARFGIGIVPPLWIVGAGNLGIRLRP
ncbi:transposase [Streptomyces sp. NPDC058653]|uniref:transposase n=1 Tax=Streptomyces sp. NPDC058653 TaxID=3346576 RepID=UPI003661FB45